MKPKHSKKMTQHEQIMYIKRGGNLRRFTRSEVRELEQLALDTKNIDLYDKLQLWYDLQKKDLDK